MESKSIFHWLFCPACGMKTRVKHNDDTVLLRFPLYCPKCRRETRVDLIDQKVYRSLERN